MKTSYLAPIAALVLFQSVSAHAAGIYQMGYRYSFDDMAWDGAHRQTFVICEDACAAAPPLAPAPRFPALSVKVSQDPLGRKEDPQKAPDGGSRETPPNKDKGDREHVTDARITVLFSLDSSVLNNVERARLSSFVKGLDAETKGGNLFVTGYTCDLGSKAHNDVLTMKRAEAVEAYLRKAGLHLCGSPARASAATRQETRVSDTSTGGLRSQSAKGRRQSEKDTRIVCYVRDYGGSAGVIVPCSSERDGGPSNPRKDVSRHKGRGDPQLRHPRTL